MVTKNNYKRLKPTLVAAMFLFLAACQGTSQDIGARIAKAGDGSSKVPRSAETAELTKAKIDPRGLDAYKGNLAAKLTKIGADSDTTWDKYFDLKKWFMASSSVAETLQAPMTTTDDTNGNFIIQQTQYEVFIDKDLYEKVEEAKKPALLLREYMKGLYLLKYLSDAQLCSLMKDVYKVKECIGVTATAPAKTASEDTEKTLSEEVDTDVDTADVDSVVNSGTDASKDAKASTRPKQTASSMTESDSKVVEAGAKYIETLDMSKATETIVRELGDKGFDTRVFKYKNLGKSAPVEATEVTKEKSYKEITLDEYKGVLAQLQEIKGRGISCYDFNDQGKLTQCPLTFAEAKEGKGVKFDLNIKVSDTLTISEGVALVTSSAKVGVGSFTDSVTKASFTLIPMTSLGLAADKQENGTAFRSQYVLAIKRSESAPLELYGLLSVPAIIKSVAVDGKTQKKTCTAETYFSKKNADGKEVSGPENQVIFTSIYATAIDPAILKTVSSPIAPCY